ncbi:MAG: 3-hydroxyacyl-CoA dehydrogenase NAD-binding domain-containing protein [Candidatus Korobacteraceae bacterium]
MAAWVADNAAADAGDNASETSVETIAVIGAGKVGRALARRAAVAGFRVVLEDLIPTSLEAARREIRRSLDDAVSSGLLDPAVADQAFARIDCATTIEDAARRARIVMETGPDEFESKLEMFCLLDRVCLPGTVIVSNCHALELSDTSAKAESIVGMYFSGDPLSGEHAEIHCSAFTSAGALAVAERLAARMASSYQITRDGDAATV